MASNFTGNGVVEIFDVEISDKEEEKMSIQNENQHIQTTEDILAYNYGKTVMCVAYVWNILITKLDFYSMVTFFISSALRTWELDMWY